MRVESAVSGRPVPDPRASRGVASRVAKDIALVALASILLTIPALFFGAGAGSVAAAAAFLGASVLAPGWILASVLVPVRGGPTARLGVALALGLAAQAILFLAAKASGFAPIAAAWPLLLAPLLPTYMRGLRVRAERDEVCRLGPGLALAAVLALVVARTPFLAADDWWARQDIDLLFHAGNAAEFARRWPVMDPRVAGEPLVYHLFGYAVTAGGHVALGLPTSLLQTLHFALVGPIALVLAAYSAARALGGGAWAGVITTVLVAAHTEIGRVVNGIFGESARWFVFHNDFDVGTFHSATTRAGLAAFAALVVIGCAWFRGESSRPRLAGAALLLAAFASGSKGSVMPVVLAGLGLALCVEAWHARRIPWSNVLFLALIGAAALPYTLWLVAAESSYASAMFRFAPMMLMRTEGPFAEAARALGHDPLFAPWSIVVLCAPLWWIGHHGAALLGALLALRRGEERVDLARSWLFGVAIAGVLVSSLVAAAGHSEMFFAYTGHLALAILAGPTVASSAARGARLGIAVFVCAALALVLAGLARTAVTTRSWLTLPQSSSYARAYRSGLDWIRDHSPQDAVFVTSGSWSDVSAFGERRTLVESRTFTPEFHAGRWQMVGDRWVRPRVARSRDLPPILAAREQFRRAPTPAGAASLRVWTGAAPLFLSSDDLSAITTGPAAVEVRALPPQANLVSNPILEAVFTNEAVAIYRVR